MRDARDQMLQTLRRNVGFDEPEAWVDYGLANGFRDVRGVPVPRCPDCQAGPSGILGQFVYYSTLMRLRTCARCGLVWADAQLDAAVVQRHFETQYKDEAYFLRGRRRIFEHLARCVARRAPARGRVLDVGGAKGHLMRRVVELRPDVRVTVHDLSSTATRWAAATYGFDTLTGDVEALRCQTRQFDVVVLSDVMYYEPRLPLLWSALAQLVAPAGAVVIRVPNKLWLIRAGQWCRRLGPRHWRARQRRIAGFNPEHLFILSRRYLTRRLRAMGCHRVEVYASPPLGGPGLPDLMAGGWFAAACAAAALTGSRCIPTPAMVLIGRRAADG